MHANKTSLSSLSPEELQHVEWTALFSIAGTTSRSALLMQAVWWERLRPYLEPTVFIEKLDAAVGFSTASLPDPFQGDVDPTHRYCAILRTFMRTMRVWIVEDIGERSLAIFYLFLVCHLMREILGPHLHTPAGHANATHRHRLRLRPTPHSNRPSQPQTHQTDLNYLVRPFASRLCTRRCPTDSFR
jgi:hypothetical protein